MKNDVCRHLPPQARRSTRSACCARRGTPTRRRTSCATRTAARSSRAARYTHNTHTRDDDVSRQECRSSQLARHRSLRWELSRGGRDAPRVRARHGRRRVGRRRGRRQRRHDGWRDGGQGRAVDRLDRDRVDVRHRIPFRSVAFHSVPFRSVPSHRAAVDRLDRRLRVVDACRRRASNCCVGLSDVCREVSSERRSPPHAVAPPRPAPPNCPRVHTHAQGTPSRTRRTGRCTRIRAGWSSSARTRGCRGCSARPSLRQCGSTRSGASA